MKLFYFLFGLIGYLSFFTAIIYQLCFMTNLQVSLSWLNVIIPKSIDYSPVQLGLLESLLINQIFLFLFALQHTGMARNFHKNWLKSFVPNLLIRPIYCWCSSLAVFFIFYFWNPIPIYLWKIDYPVLYWGIRSIFYLFWFGIIAIFLSTHKHDPLGLNAVYYNLIGKEYTPKGFSKPHIYKYIRHPVYTGFLLAFWSTPHMTIGHLQFSINITLYLMIATYLEEQDLINKYGETYRQYMLETGKLFPKIRF